MAPQHPCVHLTHVCTSLHAPPPVRRVTVGAAFGGKRAPLLLLLLTSRLPGLARGCCRKRRACATATPSRYRGRTPDRLSHATPPSTSPSVGSVASPLAPHRTPPRAHRACMPRLWTCSRSGAADGSSAPSTRASRCWLPSSARCHCTSSATMLPRMPRVRLYLKVRRVQHGETASYRVCGRSAPNSGQYYTFPIRLASQPRVMPNTLTRHASAVTVCAIRVQYRDMITRKKTYRLHSSTDR